MAEREPERVGAGAHGQGVIAISVSAIDRMGRRPVDGPPNLLSRRTRSPAAPSRVVLRRFDRDHIVIAVHRPSCRSLAQGLDDDKK